MNNDGLNGQFQQGASAPERAFRPEMARETENVLRRSSEESLDNYLKNINTYLKDLNNRLGAPSEEETTSPESAGEEAAGASEEAGDDAFVFHWDEADDSAADERYLEPIDFENAFSQRVPPSQPPHGEPPYYETQGDNAPDDSYDPYAAPYEESARSAPRRHADFSSEYAEPVAPGYVGGDWQAAVPNPELYPDLDELAGTGSPSRKRIKKEKKSRAAERPAKVTNGGKSRFSFVTTLLNLGLYGGWTVLYFVCLTVRSMMFTGTQAEMASQGVLNYSVTISSPLFTVLKIMIYAMPVVLFLWMRGVLSAEKKQVPQLDKKLLIAAFAVDLLAGFIVIFDVLAAKLVFGA
ncbi:MAG: hypothetical protein IJK98_05820 [Clostridia bacterium]|nr:hypothetical protein [Clostridia bacterium]